MIRFVSALTIAFALFISLPSVYGQDVEETEDAEKWMNKEDLEKAVKKWREDYVRYIITRNEEKEWENLKTLDDKIKFIEFFWLRRDPDPDTPENAYREDYKERWKYVNAKFTAGKPGWRTDRGKIYLMLGPPDDAQRNPFGRKTSERPSEVWYYNSLGNKKLPAQIEISFVDFMGYGDYEIVTDLDRTAEFYSSAYGFSMNNLDAYGLRRMGELRDDSEVPISAMFEEAKIRNPILLSRNLFNLQDELREIAEVPKLLVKKFDAQIKTEIYAGEIEFDVSAQAFKNESDVFLPVTISIPLDRISFTHDSKGRLYKASIYARIHNDDYFDTFDEEIQFQIPSEYVNNKMKQEESPKYLYQFGFFAPPALYDLSITVRDPLAKTVSNIKQEIDAESIMSEGLSASEIVLANDVSPAFENKVMTEENQYRAFQLGKFRVVPNVTRTLRTNQQNFYFYFHVYNLAISPDTNKPDATVTYFVYKDGNLAGKIPPGRIESDLGSMAYVTSKFDTKAFLPGKYKVVAVIEDNVQESQIKKEIEFELITEAKILQGN